MWANKTSMPESALCTVRQELWTANVTPLSIHQLALKVTPKMFFGVLHALQPWLVHALLYKHPIWLPWEILLFNLSKARYPATEDNLSNNSAAFPFRLAFYKTVTPAWLDKALGGLPSCTSATEGTKITATKQIQNMFHDYRINLCQKHACVQGNALSLRVAIP